MSHHLDTPLARQNGRLYLDDLFVFPGDHSTVMIMDANSTVTGPDVQRGFHPEARYEFKIHFDGADFEALTYRFAFGEADEQGQQTVQLYVLTGNEARDDAAIGTLVADAQTGETVAGDNLRCWAGRIADPFYVDLDRLSTVNAAIGGGTAVDDSAWHVADAKNSFAGTTVESIVLEISDQNAELPPGAHIGVWATSKLATDARGWKQINRAGHPMMWPIFWPHDTDFSNPANDRHPSQDVRADAENIGGQVAAVVAASGSSTDPAGYGQTVAQELFPDVLSYVVGTPASYGFAGRNGRTLADNAPEAMFSLVTDSAMTSGLTPDVAAAMRSTGFPYVVAG